ncbi:MAG: hypothetical protein GX542_02140 [Rhodococcus sp.]|nr:hypothetical protein [Rhodococcus sp. (in: high G+C Gram-positive bacteria)]
MSGAQGMEPDKAPLMEVLRDDPALAAQLRKSVQVLADHAPDPAMGQMLRQVLSGDKNLRDVFAGTDFPEMFRPYTEAAVAEVAHMTDEEKEASVEQGRSQIDAAYEAARATQSAPASGEVDDDEYFRNRGSILKSEW